uniref:Uncharacterized protein n=1 Tax=Oryza meridionalis TaxID=40149 RepID=A0A0E0F2L1_9ORYZ
MEAERIGLRLKLAHDRTALLFSVHGRFRELGLRGVRRPSFASRRRVAEAPALQRERRLGSRLELLLGGIAFGCARHHQREPGRECANRERTAWNGSSLPPATSSAERRSSRCVQFGNLSEDPFPSVCILVFPLNTKLVMFWPIVGVIPFSMSVVKYFAVILIASNVVRRRSYSNKVQTAEVTDFYDCDPANPGQPFAPFLFFKRSKKSTQHTTMIQAKIFLVISIFGDE